MAYPLIILGAGASYDFTSKDGVKKAPLTDTLTEEPLTGYLKKYPDAGHLLSDIHAKSKNSVDTSFESILNKILINSGQQNHRTNQFIDLSFYLQDLFQHISEGPEYYHPRNNHSVLFSNIQDAGGRACIVSFNYDSLFERSIINNIQFKSLDSYITHPIKLIKPHGSHDWVYIASKENIRFLDTPESSRDFLRANPQYINQIRSAKNPSRPYHKEEVRDKNYYNLPALALPITKKQGFICPSNHVDVLQSEINHIDRILIIGWKAADQELIDLLTPMLKEKKHLPIYIVVGDKDGEKVGKVFSNINDKLKIEVTNLGFSSFVGSESANKFFADKP